jgi:hypothetical protein
MMDRPVSSREEWRSPVAVSAGAYSWARAPWLRRTSAEGTLPYDYGSARRASSERGYLRGANRGGFFNANGAHPYEGPTPFVKFLVMLAIAVLSSSLTITFGAA